MPSIQIKGVPDEVHAVLRRRAADANQSLQEYLLARLVDDASRPTLAEAFGRVDLRVGGSAPLDVVVEIVRHDRDRR